MDFEFIDPWHGFVPRDPGHVVAAVGSGGKTSILEVVHDLLLADGVPVAVTTTTRTEPLSWGGLEALDYDRVPHGALDIDAPSVFIGRGCVPETAHADGKWRGLSPGEVDDLHAHCPGRVVLVEADGAAKHPLKLHRDDEPLLPSRTSLVLNIAGLSSVGRRASEVVHRFDQTALDRLGCACPDGIWGWDEMLQLLCGPRGYVARIPDGVPQVLGLLQLDECDDSIGLFGFLDRLMTDSGIPLVLAGDTSGPEPRLRTACPAGPRDP